MPPRRLPPRPGNAMRGVREFIQQWDAPEVSDTPLRPDSRRSPFGNLNSSGEPGCEEALVLTLRDRSFAGVLEDGVRDLVFAFASRLGWITYTSCEGHEYPGTGREPVERHVGLLPRNPTEWSAIQKYLEDMCRWGSTQDTASVVEFALMEQTLVDDIEAFPVIDIYFAIRQGGHWADYFSSLPARYNQFLNHVCAP